MSVFVVGLIPRCRTEMQRCLTPGYFLPERSYKKSKKHKKKGKKRRHKSVSVPELSPHTRHLQKYGIISIEFIITVINRPRQILTARRRRENVKGSGKKMQRRIKRTNPEGNPAQTPSRNLLKGKRLRKRFVQALRWNTFVSSRPEMSNSTIVVCLSRAAGIHQAVS